MCYDGEKVEEAFKHKIEWLTGFLEKYHDGLSISKGRKKCKRKF